MRNLHLHLFLILLFLCVSRSGIAQEQEVGDSTIVRVAYLAPLSGKVFLVTKFMDDGQATGGLPAGAGDKLQYHPMQADGDRFGVELTLPLGETFYYCFWITRNRAGDYQDFWDISSGRTVTVVEDLSISRVADYEQTFSRGPTGIMTRGWILFLVLLMVYLGIDRLVRTSTVEKGEKYRWILALGISLGICQLALRVDIVGVRPYALVAHPRNWQLLLAAGIDDLLFLTALMGVFLLLAARLSSRRSGRLLKAGFTFLALISFGVSLMNVSIVQQMGQPFTYQWLYYADFLGGEAAFSAMRANVSLLGVVNTLAWVGSMLLLALIIDRLGGASPVGARSGWSVSAAMVVAVLVLGYIRLSYPPASGRDANPVVAFTHSYFTSDGSQFFFNSETAGSLEYFREGHEPLPDSVIYLTDRHAIESVLFLVLESTGAVYFQQYGGRYDATPNFDRYAKKGVLLERMHAQAPSSNRSLVGLLSSVHPELTFKSITKEYPKNSFPSLSSELTSRGFRTSFISSADFDWQNCLEYLEHREFQVVEDYHDLACDQEFRLADERYTEAGGIDDLCIADRLESWLQEAPESPFFSMLWTVQPHYPYYTAGEEQEYVTQDISLNRYLNALHRDDELLGAVMGTLEAQGLDSTTLVVVVGDHGEAFGQHGQYGHAGTLYEEDTHVPCLLINPHLVGGITYPHLASLKDLPATALSVLGIEQPAVWQGNDLFRTAAKEGFYFSPWSDYRFGYRSQGYKYLFNESRGTTEVYNLSTDPNELDNLFTSHPKEAINYARSRISAWVRQQDERFTALSTTQ